MNECKKMSVLGRYTLDATNQSMNGVKDRKQKKQRVMGKMHMETDNKKTQQQ